MFTVIRQLAEPRDTTIGQLHGRHDAPTTGAIKATDAACGTRRDDDEYDTFFVFVLNGCVRLIRAVELSAISLHSSGRSGVLGLGLATSAQRAFGAKVAIDFVIKPRTVVLPCPTGIHESTWKPALSERD